ncbi:hypothetical protein LshimejAT787_0310300 [Lyophyllum shimeji]|uniref:Nephrocystin 3-like N-terminal domain-containing protein n=1 Tax=Lyophyllum shimeji TaxID=47721 RepID=A0A9P3UKJ8_LYOSH|nr:hypothetical protein LshimejAT787_0310300 [Lyophyllum shimeji]
MFRGRSPSPQRPPTKKSRRDGAGSSSRPPAQESTAYTSEPSSHLVPTVFTNKAPSESHNVHPSTSALHMDLSNAQSVNVFGGNFTDVQGNSNIYNGPVSILHAERDPLDRLRHEMISYKTRHSSYGDPSGCMPGTRVRLLADFISWARDDSTPRVFWLTGMAGTGKSTISHSLCEILDARKMLGASFFCSRGSETARNARLIVPTIAHGLASTSSAIRSDIIKAIGDDPRLAEPTYINVEDQFDKLIRRPIQTSISRNLKTYKIVVIDAVDECSDLQFVSTLIRLILKLSFDLPLKLFIASRNEELIHNAFYSSQDPLTAFQLHEVGKHVVADDIRLFIEKSLRDIKSPGLDRTVDAWPAPFELCRLIEHSGQLFIYPATALRYIRDGGKLFKARLSDMANREPKSGSKQQTSMIDDLYGHILRQACAPKEESEILPMRRLISIIIFLRNPLPIYALTEFAQIDAEVHLSALTAVIHVPTQPEAAVAPFHASFPDFVTDPSRCSPERCPSFAALIPAECHIILTLRCMQLMNSSLKYNICGIPRDMTVSRQDRVNLPEYMTKISEELKYACVYWASHLVNYRNWVLTSYLCSVIFSLPTSCTG